MDITPLQKFALSTQYNERERVIKWIEALESGSFPQTRGRLYQDEDSFDATDEEGNEITSPKGYCCLGVFCFMAGLPNEYLNKIAYPSTLHGTKINNTEFTSLVRVTIPVKSEFLLAYMMIEDLKFEAVDGDNKWITNLSDLNDNGVDFKTIAGALRKML